MPNRTAKRYADQAMQNAAEASRLKAEQARCLSILSEHLGTSHETLEDAVRNLAQAYVSERDSARLLEQRLRELYTEVYTEDDRRSDQAETDAQSPPRGC